MSVQATEWVAAKISPDLKVKLAAKMVLNAFARRADKTGRAAYPSLSTIAWELGCTERNVADHVKALIDKGLLVVSPDQSPAAGIAAEYRPVVYDLPIYLVRTDEKPERQKRGRRPQAVGLDLKDSSVTASLSGDLGMKDSSISHEENFPLDLKKTSFGPEENFIQVVLEESNKQSVEPLPHVSNASADAPSGNDPTEDHVHALCTRLHERVLANGLTADPPAITRQWELAARALIQLDGRDPNKVLNLIDWCQADDFWRAQILDMPTFRRKYTTLHAKATAQWQTRKAASANNIPLADQRFHDLIAQGERLRKLAATQNPTPTPALTRQGFFAPLRQLEADPHTWETPAA
ncbi:helix-turn-helix domain-containing protein [Nocardia sp. NPDC056611]|uniref:helix-turn-helix domain-containing protein n=1 Tax=Nocardia sp. NPDC056611 TaxID=3345877 RepID=UPI00366B7239